MPSLRVNGAEFYYEEAGTGTPVLLLHGLGSNAGDWEFQAAALSRQYRAIAMDVRGHGRSSKPPGPYSVAQFAADAVALLRGLGAAPAHVVGLSMGGMIAFQMAVDSPDMVRSLTIVNSGPEMILRTLKGRMMIRMRFAIVRLFGMRSMGRTIAKALFPDPGQEGLRQRFADTLGANDPRAYLDALRAINGWSVLDRIGGIGCPALVASSDRDYSPVEWKRQYAALMPRAEVAVIAGSRHAAPLDSPEELNRLILGFLAGARANAPSYSTPSFPE